MVRLFRRPQKRFVDFDQVSEDFPHLTGPGLEALTVILDVDIAQPRHKKYTEGTYKSYLYSLGNPDEILADMMTLEEYSVACILNLIGESDLGRVRLGKSPIKLTEGKYKYKISERQFMKIRKNDRRQRNNPWTKQGEYRRRKDRARRHEIFSRVESRYNTLVEKAISNNGNSLESAVARVEGFEIDPDWFLECISCAVYAINSPGDHTIPNFDLKEGDYNWKERSFILIPGDKRSLVGSNLPGIPKDARYN